MRRGLKKLNSQRGASFLIALAGFLMAMMVAVTIISAAYTAVKDVYSDRESEQNHLTLSSAAELVRTELSETTCRIVETKDTKDTSKSTVTVTAEGPLAEEMKAAVLAAKDGLADYQSTSATSFTVQASGLDDVGVSYVMHGKDDQETDEKQFEVVFTMAIDGGETVYLDANATSSQNSVTSGNTIVTTTNLQWTTGSISGGAYE